MSEAKRDVASSELILWCAAGFIVIGIAGLIGMVQTLLEDGLDDEGDLLTCLVFFAVFSFFILIGGSVLRRRDRQDAR
jgi:hypothetical protein